MKILITAGKTATALKLIKAFPDHEILLADYGEMPSIVSTSYKFTALGGWNEEIAAHHLLTKCLDLGVDALLPLYEGEIAAVAKSLLLFEEFGLKVFVPEPSQLTSFSKEISTKHWCFFDSGQLIYAGVEYKSILAEGIKQHLNGAYYFDPVAKEFALIHVANPA